MELLLSGEFLKSSVGGGNIEEFGSIPNSLHLLHQAYFSPFSSLSVRFSIKLLLSPCKSKPNGHSARFARNFAEGNDRTVRRNFFNVSSPRILLIEEET